MNSEMLRLQTILRRLGLAEKEAEVYIAIATKGTATAKDLLNTLERMHQPQLYNTISSLLRKGFIRVSMSRPKVYVANDLESIFEARKRLLDNLKGDALSLLEKIKRMEEETGKEESQVFLIRKREGLEAGIFEILSSSRVEVCADLPTDIALNVADTIETLLNKGINVYMIVFPEVPASLSNKLSKYRNIVLKRDELGSFLFVSADTEVAIYARRRFFSPRKIPIPENEVYGFYISERDLIWRLFNMFEAAWRRSGKPLIHHPPSPEDYPKNFIEFGMALDELNDLLRRGYKPLVHVDGISVKTQEPITVEGYAVKVERTNHINNFLLDNKGRKITIGGFDAEIEDVEAHKITIKRIEKD